MAVSAPPIPEVRRDIWHGPLGPALALGLVFLPFAAALLWAMSARPAADARELAQAVRTTADTVGEHAEVMARIGERIAAAARAAEPADARWASYAEHLSSDARSLYELETRLRETAIVAAADPMHRGRLDVAGAILEARWEQLRADGRATAVHGSVMAEQARAMAAVPHAEIATDADLIELEQASNGMREAGERTVRVAEQLLSSVSQMQRWLGISR